MRAIMSSTVNRKCPSCGQLQEPGAFHYKWKCPHCATPLKLASSAPFIVATIVALLLGAFAPTGDIALWIYVAAGLTFVVWLQRLLARREGVVIDTDREKPRRPPSDQPQ